MGIAANVISKARSWFARDKERMGAELKRGDDFVRYQQPGPHGTGYQQLSDDLRLDNDLMARYADYEEMDDYPEISSACDVYADDATVPDMDHGQAVWASSEDDIVRLILDDLLTKRLRVEDDIWPLVRNTVKYGNTFGEVLASDEGVVGINFLPTPTVRRVETKKGTLIGFVQDPKGQFNLTNAEVRAAIEMAERGADSKTSQTDEDLVIFEPWELIHWRLKAKQVRAPYGHAVLEAARWLFRRLVMFEDSALIYKLTRSPARFAYYVDVGDLPTGQAMAYVNHVKREFKKRKVYNPGTKFLGLRHNPLGMNEDIWLPMRGGQETTRVDVLAGPDYQVVDDLEYFRGKLFSALKVPRSYLGFEPEASRQALSQVDVRFARTVMRIQREIRNGFRQIARLHLAILGIDPDQVKWDVHMTIPSHIFELAQIELRSAKADIADRLEPWMTKPWILERIWGFSEDDAVYHGKAKNDEEREGALREASIQQEIAEKYPDAAGLVPEEEPAPTEEDVAAAVEKGLDRLEQRMFERDRKLGTKLDEMMPAVEDLRRDMRFRRSSGRSRSLRRVG